MSRRGTCVLAGALFLGLIVSPAAGHATSPVVAAPEADKTEQGGCWYGASTGLSMVAPSVIDGSAFAVPLFITQSALLASPIVQFTAAAGVVALSFCYAGQAIAPLYTHLTQADPLPQ